MSESERLDAACALLLDEGYSSRVAGGVLGLSRTTVLNRAVRYANREAGPEGGFAPEVRAFVAEKLQEAPVHKLARWHAPETWESRVSRLKETPGVWQAVHSMPYNSASSAVTKLRGTRMDIGNGGPWQFRVQPDTEREHGGVVMAKWCGTPCTNCGAVSVANPCPLCGHDKAGA